MQLHTSDILEIDLELTNACNLSCPLCARETNSVSLKYHKRTLDDWTNQIREYKNLERVSLIGIISEPTLYKHFKNKKELFLACFNSIITHLRDENRKVFKKFKDDGATILGGCCETRPSHIKAMSEIR